MGHWEAKLNSQMEIQYGVGTKVGSIINVVLVDA